MTVEGPGFNSWQQMQKCPVLSRDTWFLGFFGFPPPFGIRNHWTHDLYLLGRRCATELCPSERLCFMSVFLFWFGFWRHSLPVQLRLAFEHYAAKADLNTAVLLSQAPKCWVFRCGHWLTACFLVNWTLGKGGLFLGGRKANMGFKQ